MSEPAPRHPSLRQDWPCATRPRPVSGEPERVEHAQPGIAWQVTGILDRWAHPGRVEDAIGKATLIKWWLLRVSGPLPGRPAESGEFVMEVSGYGHRPGWWITVEP